MQLLTLMDDSIRQHQHSTGNTGNGGDSLNFTLEDLIIVPPFSSQHHHHHQDHAEHHDEQQEEEEDHNDEEEEGDRTEEEEEDGEDESNANEENGEKTANKNHRFEIDWPCLQIEMTNDKSLVSSVTEEHHTSNMNRLKLLLKDRLTQMISEMNHSRDTNEGDADDQDGNGRDALVVTATQPFQFYLLFQLHGRLALPTRDTPSVFADPSLRANEIFFRSKL